MTEYLGNMPFLCLEADDEPGTSSIRSYLESNAIGILSRALGVDPPSGRWLGRYASDERIRSSGLWNVKQVGSTYDPRFLDALASLARGERPELPPPEARRSPPPPGPPVPSARPIPPELASLEGPILALISCSKKKASHPCRAVDLYQPSTLFRLSYALASKVAGKTLILSAKHGLVRPEDALAPYDQTLAGAPAAELERWANAVSAQLADAPEYREARTVIWFAGKAYRGHLLQRIRADGKASVVPMEGLSQGKQLEWLKRLESRRGPVWLNKASTSLRATLTSTPSARAPRIAQNGAPSADDFRRILRDLLTTTKADGKVSLRITAGELHRIVGGYPGRRHRMPICCRVMKDEMRSGDRIVASPPSGQGASLAVRYQVS